MEQEFNTQVDDASLPEVGFNFQSASSDIHWFIDLDFQKDLSHVQSLHKR